MKKLKAENFIKAPIMGAGIFPFLFLFDFAISGEGGREGKGESRPEVVQQGKGHAESLQVPRAVVLAPFSAFSAAPLLLLSWERDSVQKQDGIVLDKYGDEESSSISKDFGGAKIWIKDQNETSVVRKLKA